MRTILVLFALTTLSMTAQQPIQPTVDVTGEGTITVVPDQVIVNVRVENTGKNPSVVKQENDRTVNNVLEFVKKMNIESKHIKTAYVRLSKNYEHNTKTYNYAANQSITIQLNDLSKYDDLINGLLETGINRIDGVQFQSSNREALEAQARIKAVEDAKMKAESYAKVLDQTIGKAVSISEFQPSSDPRPMYRSMAMEADSSGGQETIAPGELEIRVRINVSFVLN